VLIRRESSTDLAAVRELTRVAFARDGEEPVEVRLLEALRTDAAWIPELSLVAQSAGRVVGHVVCTRACVDSVPAVGLGPISVLPGRQRSGIGSALMHAVLGAADAMGEPLVGLLGDPAYYGRFGFVASGELGIAAPDPGWGRSFQVRILAAYDASLHGGFVYAEPFQDL
jgi:putative acetyltransferase